MSDAIEEALKVKADTALVVKWIVVAEIVEADGTRAHWADTSEGLKAWDGIGLLQTALIREQHRVLRDMFPDDDDG